jgi:FkbM family methyltransferase
MFPVINIKIKELILRSLDLLTPCRFARWSYAQEGEDVAFLRFLDKFHGTVGKYVDVGSNHPWKYSNTALLYKQGWRGVAIDPNPTFRSLFATERPEDVFLNIGVSDHEGELLYYEFEINLYNTFCDEKARSLVERKLQPKPQVSSIPVRTLSSALLEVWPNGQCIDLLSIDAEGFDVKIIKGHDFRLFPVSFIIAELDCIVPFDNDQLVSVLRAHGYEMVSKLFKSAIFLHQSQFIKYEIGS